MLKVEAFFYVANFHVIAAFFFFFFFSYEIGSQALEILWSYAVIYMFEKRPF